MNRAKRDAARQTYEALRQSRAAQAAARAEGERKREAAVQAALAKSQVKKRSGVLPSVLNSDSSPHYVTYMQTVAEKAERLLVPAYMDALRLLCEQPHIRPIQAWEPRGKGRDSVFRSLAEHLLAKYPVPAFLWTAFFEDEARKLAPLVVHIASGGAIYDLVKTGKLPVPLTRRMCHDFLQTTGYGFVSALRRVQIRTAGGDIRLFDVWKTLRHGRSLNSKEDEAFWASVIEWFAKVPMLEPGQVGPICDYLIYRRRQDPAFSMKGRSALAVIRGMQEWHGTLSKEKGVKATIYRQSGWKPAEFDDYKRKESNGTIVDEIWRVQEILTARGLYEEGKRMGHCVYSYSFRVESGDTSIWSMTMEDGQGDTGNWAMLTIEVRNDLRRIVQARGRFNRARTAREQQVLMRWAALNGLEVSLGAW